MQLLEIAASPRFNGSTSRTLLEKFVSAWQQHNPNVKIARHDIGQTPPAHPSQQVIEASFVPADARDDAMQACLAPSEQCIDEFMAASHIVIATPMHNYGVPSTLKAYIDNLVRNQRTFSVDPQTYAMQGLAVNKKALLIISSGQDYPAGSEAEKLDFCAPYLQAILGFIGIEDIEVVRASNQAVPAPVSTDAVEAASTALAALAQRWT